MKKTIKIDHIAKIEGHAKLYIKVEKGAVKQVKMEVIEGSRFFENIVQGRMFYEAPLITSRICGVCPIAHQTASLMAMEKILKVKPSKQTLLLREIQMIGQHLQSHILHLYFLALPDYVGCKHALELADKKKKELGVGLRLKKIANDIVFHITGRNVHGITPTIGGYSVLPSQETIDNLYKELKKAKNDFEECIKLFSKIKYPKFEREFEQVVLKRTKDNMLFGDRIISLNGKDISIDDYKGLLCETVKEYSTAKHVCILNESYMTGSLPRINLNHEFLSKPAKQWLKKIKLPCYNSYYNNFAQAVEVIELYHRALDILKDIKIVDEQPQKITLKAGKGVAAVEAPRGILIHDYEIDKAGVIRRCNIITPTTQNLKNIEEDIKELLPKLLDRSEKTIIKEIEKLIRAYDPCISCSTHFLELNIDRI